MDQVEKDRQTVQDWSKTLYTQILGETLGITLKIGVDHPLHISERIEQALMNLAAKFIRKEIGEGK